MSQHVFGNNAVPLTNHADLIPLGKFLCGSTENR